MIIDLRVRLDLRTLFQDTTEDLCYEQDHGKDDKISIQQ